MRKLLLIPSVAIALSIAAAMPSAAATLKQVQALCSKNPNCSQVPGKPGDKWVDFCINGKNRCETQVGCPKNGDQCQMTIVQNGQRTKHGSKGVDKVLAGGAGATPRPSRTPSAGILDSGPGFTSQGPAATGSPVGGGAPAPAAGPVLR
ncbi:MAG: hypothetical protein K2Z80_00600 [Xanthobacteraceae bacterium]|nr:hypothetical protein [Xanthobacteraceae bacterium]